MHNREEIAHRHGYETFAELLDVSDPLPLLPDDRARTYVARHKNGYWFCWVDAPVWKLREPDGVCRVQK